MGLILQNIELVVVISLLLPGRVFTVDPYFWHVTDLHFDPTYSTTQDSCNEVIDNPGLFGDFECDAPYHLVKHAVQGMKNLWGTPKFVLYSGDSPPHPKNYTDFSTDHVRSLIYNATTLLKDTFETIPIILAVGNHDYYPKDQLPGQTNAVYDAMANILEDWGGVDQAEVENFRKGGYYSTLLETNLRVIVTNTNLYLSANDVTVGQADPAEQYAWLRTQLQNAANNHEWVHLVAHVPPGVMEVAGGPRWLREEDNTKFNEIVREFASVIVGFYSCHQHFDTFRMYYDENGKPISTMLLAPSVTPWRARIGSGIRAAAHNPGIRKISYDDTNGHLTDVAQYYLDLNRANSGQQTSWLLYYTFRGLYGVDNVTASALGQLVKEFRPYGSDQFHHYYAQHAVGAKEPSNEPCSCDCKFLHICAIENVDFADYENCQSDFTCGVERHSFNLILICVALWALIV